MRVYLDSAPIIYLVENTPPYISRLVQHLSSNEVVQVCSELSRLECRVKPVRDNELALLIAFDTYFAEIVSEIVPLSRAVMELATDIRARYQFKTPDAIHLACAIVARCDIFLTNDAQLTRCNEIEVILLSD